MRPIRDILRDYAVLDAEGRHINGTDKQSNHNYGDAYDSLFRRWTRNDVRLMMEVGVADGSCLLAWREVFPNATIVGMDIHRSEKAEGIGMGFPPDRIEFHLGDQRSRADLERAVNNRRFDIIIEDATHKLADTLVTLYYLWPHVAPGGMYIVEEWDGAAGDRKNIQALFPGAGIINTIGPFGGNEPLVVFFKGRYGS